MNLKTYEKAEKIVKELREIQQKIRGIESIYFSDVSTLFIKSIHSERPVEITEKNIVNEVCRNTINAYKKEEERLLEQLKNI